MNEDLVRLASSTFVGDGFLTPEQASRFIELLFEGPSIFRWRIGFMRAKTGRTGRSRRRHIRKQRIALARADAAALARLRARMAAHRPPPETSWRFYDGMSRERFDELRARGALPVTLGSYEEVMAQVVARKAEREAELFGTAVIEVVDGVLRARERETEG